MGHGMIDKEDSAELLDSETIRDLTWYFVDGGDPDGDRPKETDHEWSRGYRAAEDLDLDKMKESITKKEIILYQRETLEAAWRAYGDKVDVWEELYFRRRWFVKGEKYE